jgi:membrane protease YdiL (CAAX protease family)
VIALSEPSGDQAAPQPSGQTLQEWAPAVEPAPLKVWTPLASLMMLVATIGGQLVVGLGAGILMSVAAFAHRQDLVQTWAMALMLLGSMGSNLLLLLLQRRRTGARPLWDSADLRNPWAWGGVALTLLACFVANALHIYFVPQGDPPALNRDVLDLISQSRQIPWGPLALVFASTVLLAPLTEEWLFRGILQPALGRKLTNWAAIPLTALVFGLLHGLDGWWVAGIYGLAIGLLSSRLRSLAMPMLVHGLLNLTVFGLMVGSGMQMR